MDKKLKVGDLAYNNGLDMRVPFVVYDLTKEQRIVETADRNSNEYSDAAMTDWIDSGNEVARKDPYEVLAATGELSLKSVLDMTIRGIGYADGYLRIEAYTEM